MEVFNTVFRPAPFDVEPGGRDSGLIHDWRSSLGPTLALMTLVGVDRALQTLNPWQRLPAPVLGVFAVVVAGVSLRQRDDKSWERVYKFFEPALLFLTHSYLTLFYSPALVLLPVALPRDSGIDLVTRVVVIITIGCLITACCTAAVVKAIRRYSRNDHPVPDSIEQDDVRFSAYAVASWLLAAAVCSALSWSRRFVTLSQLTLSVGVYCASVRIPRPLNRWLNPMTLIALAINLQALIFGRLHDDLTYGLAIGIYAESVKPVFFSFLGPIILCFALSIVQRWELVVAHRLELLFGCFVSAAITILSTAFISVHLLEDARVTRSLLSRGMTMALAVVNTQLLDGSVEITAVAVALTGLIGSMLIRPVLNTLKYTDVIVRGVTASATAHGLGAAVRIGLTP